jgi:hypothetical protein
MANSGADFVDIHGYSIPGDLTMSQLVQNYGFTGYQQQKPVFMGEFGAFKSGDAIISDAAAALQSWQMATCPYEVKGWLLWTWNTDNSEEGIGLGGPIGSGRKIGASNLLTEPSRNRAKLHGIHHRLRDPV